MRKADGNQLRHGELFGDKVKWPGRLLWGIVETWLGREKIKLWPFLRQPVISGRWDRSASKSRLREK